MILFKNLRENKNEILRKTQNNIINNTMNRFEPKKPHFSGERPQNPNQTNPVPRPREQFTAPHPHMPFSEPHAAPHFMNPHPPKPMPRNPPFNNMETQEERNQPLQNQPHNFNFAPSNKQHITRPPNIMKPPMIKPQRFGPNITNPPRPNMNNMNNITEPQMNTNNFQKQGMNQFKEVPFAQKNIEPTPKEENLIKAEPMNQDEEMVYNYFNNYIETYNEAYKDENKRKDFANKVNALLKKLENHEIQNSLIKYLQEFMNLKAKKDNNGTRRLYMGIQWVN